MKVREIVRNSALILNRTDIISYLDGEQNTGVDTLESLNLLTNLCALVVDELSRTYLPLTKMEKVTLRCKKRLANVMLDRFGSKK